MPTLTRGQAAGEIWRDPGGPLAHAHTGAGAVGGLLHGFGHPFSGWDHILAMVAAGIWAAQIGGRAIWLVPLSFVSVMAIGGALGVAGLPLAFVEPGILASIFILGLLITLAVRLPLSAAIPLVAVFALCHGHAHGTEMASSYSGALYSIGFALATTSLHAVGIALGLGIQSLLTAPAVRLAGAGIVVAAIMLAFV